ncbi:Sec1-like protein [Rozella allomycis CSF55]|uniref:Sec1-like 2 domain-containing protein n=1 Tax=Rozella allomycis (strain CSF55) TaxID=988480 RepID=A0A075AT07_ROZAC|nr:Sec1-like 2 domain-containing protein [Rozella allomycis CSF55]RKP21198.1 Sec1-like protein [Rozella allomycis CSF55]|eukprot:EPZ31623.1 Sec1-like 2 domain-containing protein [Rozella allomycis CSF55]
MTCLRAKQTLALTEMLKSVDSLFKVLIYDAKSQEIISPLLKVSDLRDLGVTIFLALQSERMSVDDVPAVYFVEPRLYSIRRISQDLEKGLYEQFYLNFTSSLPRPLLEELVSLTVNNQTYGKIVKVYDQYLNFVTLEDYLFSLQAHDSFSIIHGPTTSQTVIDEFIDKTTQGLFSLCVTLASKGNAAEIIASKIESRLRDYMLNNRNVTTNSDVFKQRPVAERIDEEITKYKKEVEEVTRMGGVESINDLNPSDNQFNAQQLKVAISAVPKLTERKRIIDMHMNLATCLLDEIKTRTIDNFIALEEDFNKTTKTQILDILNGQSSSNDKLRLVIASILANPGQDYSDLKTKLESLNINISAIRFIEKMTDKNVKVSSSNSSQDLFGKFKLPENFREGSSILGGALGNLMSGVKKLFPVHSDSIITRMIDSILLNEQESESDFVSLDPTQSKADKKGKNTTPVAPKEDAIVFLRTKRKIIYGATEIVTPDKFLNQLQELGIPK